MVTVFTEKYTYRNLEVLSPRYRVAIPLEFSTLSNGHGKPAM